MRHHRKSGIARMIVIFCIMSMSLSACGTGESETTVKTTTEPLEGTLSEAADVVGTTSAGESTESAPEEVEEVEECPFERFVYDLPDGYKRPNEHAGTVIEEHYTTYTYDDNGVAGEEIESTLYVYTPYGYDETQEYNILYLMHGGGEEEGYWLGMGPYAEGGAKYSKTQQKYTTNVVDNMIANGDCGNVIIVTPTFYNNADGMSVSRFKYELKNDIIPYVESKYATYADGDVSEENLIATRDHRAFAGFSMGSMVTSFAVWDGCLEYFAYLGNYSGMDPNEVGIVDSILEKMSAGGIYADYDIKYWFNGTGTLDSAESDHLAHYAQLLEGGADFLSEGEDYAAGNNCIMVDKPGKGHAYNGWIVDLYNSLLVFFQAS